MDVMIPVFILFLGSFFCLIVLVMIADFIWTVVLGQ